MYFCIQSSIRTQDEVGGCKSALNTPTLMVYFTDRSKAVVPVLALLFVALWFILRGDLFCLVLFRSFVFQSFFALQLRRLRKRELILVLFVRLFDLRLFDFACLHFFLVSEKGCSL